MKRKERPLVDSKDQGTKEKKRDLPLANLNDYHAQLLISFRSLKTSFSDIKNILNNLISDYPRIQLDQMILDTDFGSYGLLAVAIIYKTPVGTISNLIDEFKLNYQGVHGRFHKTLIHLAIEFCKTEKDVPYAQQVIQFFLKKDLILTSYPIAARLSFFAKNSLPGFKKFLQNFYCGSSDDNSEEDFNSSLETLKTLEKNLCLQIAEGRPISEIKGTHGFLSGVFPGINIGEIRDKGNTNLVCGASSALHTEAMKWLVELGLPLQSSGFFYNTPIFLATLACEEENFAQWKNLTAFLKSQVPEIFFSRHPDGGTLAHAAAYGEGCEDLNFFFFFLEYISKETNWVVSDSTPRLTGETASSVIDEYLKDIGERTAMESKPSSSSSVLSQSMSTLFSSLSVSSSSSSSSSLSWSPFILLPSHGSGSGTERQIHIIKGDNHCGFSSFGAGMMDNLRRELFNMNDPAIRDLLTRIYNRFFQEDQKLGIRLEEKQKVAEVIQWVKLTNVFAEPNYRRVRICLREILHEYMNQHWREVVEILAAELKNIIRAAIQSNGKVDLKAFLAILNASHLSEGNFGKRLYARARVLKDDKTLSIDSPDWITDMQKWLMHRKELYLELVSGEGWASENIELLLLAKLYGVNLFVDGRLIHVAGSAKPSIGLVKDGPHFNIKALPESTPTQTSTLTHGMRFS